MIKQKILGNTEKEKAGTAEQLRHEKLPSPPSGDHTFTVKRIGVKDKAVWFVLGNTEYDLMNYADFNEGSLWNGAHTLLKALIEMGPLGYCNDVEDLRALKDMQLRVRVKVSSKGYANVIGIRSVE